MRPAPAAALFVLLTSLLALPAVSAEAKPLTASTGKPVLLEDGDPISLPAFTEEQLPEVIKAPMPRKPAGLGPQARFGFNFWVGQKNLVWAIDPRPSGEWLLFLDLNANRDLSDDAPLRFQEEKGRPTAWLRTEAREEVDGQTVTYPVENRLWVGEEPSGKGGALRKVLIRQHRTLRRGTMRAGGREVAFGLVGVLGLYDHKKAVVVFDWNGDGRFDLSGRQSAERYPLMEKHVNLAGQTYEMRVDRYGRSLTLVPLASRLPDRAVLLPGHVAPEFTAVDMDGKPRRLADYRGKVVLLDFWFNSCGPCWKEAPKLVEIHRRFRARGFEVLGVNSVDKPETAREFAAEHGTTWPQILEGREAPVHRLYRVEARPTYYLIGRDGKIVSGDLRPGPELIEQLEKIL
ncbi:MAG TPA: TlpA disulfide reductase family protein [Thermoanaerobaculia bacterium]|nr:TlpA disulfide reductase family protein [Thermoanaerobaculia bacterium]